MTRARSRILSGVALAFTVVSRLYAGHAWQAYDNFDDSVIDSTKWETVIVAGANQPVETGGRLRFSSSGAIDTDKGCFTRVKQDQLHGLRANLSLSSATTTTSEGSVQISVTGPDLDVWFSIWRDDNLATAEAVLEWQGNEIVSHSQAVSFDAFYNASVEFRDGAFVFTLNGATFASGQAAGASVTAWQLGTWGLAGFCEGYADNAEILTEDLTPPDPVIGLSAAPGNRQVGLRWMNPTTPDFDEVLILRQQGEAVDNIPATGQTYSRWDAIGDSTVVYLGALSEYSDTDLENDTEFFYSVFSYDAAYNYAAGVKASAIPTGDADADGMDDDWEEAHGGDLDPLSDDDHDGIVNIVEFEADLDPVDSVNPDDPALYDLWVIIQPGWNLISVPRLTQPVTAGELFAPHSIGVVWRWDTALARYEESTDELLSWQQGYWLYAQSFNTIKVQYLSGSMELRGTNDFNNDGSLTIEDAQIFNSYITTKAVLGREPTISEVQNSYDSFVSSGLRFPTTVVSLPGEE